LAIGESRHGILICTPNTAESYWLKLEHDEMLQRGQRDPDFRIIPLLVRGDLPELFGVQANNAVDFRAATESGYRIAFRQLLNALQGAPPGPPAEFDGELEFPAFAAVPDESAAPGDSSAAVSRWTADVISQLLEHRVVLLLSQADRLSEQERRRLFDQANEQFGPDAVYRVRAPRHASAPAEFFQDVGFQCGLESTDSVLTFKQRWKELTAGRTVLLIVFGFESCEATQQDLFGSCLRSIYDERDGFHALVAGGGTLHGLFVTGDEQSLFTVADVRFGPDPSPADVRAEWTSRRDDEPNEQGVTSILQLSGGHPRLLHKCWNFVSPDGVLNEPAARSALRDLPVLTRAFSAALRTPEDHRQCAQWLEQDIVGRWSTALPRDSLLAALFWNNLLRREARDLRWRCDIIREVGREFVTATSETAE
jgi:hypothetical protein